MECPAAAPNVSSALAASDPSSLKISHSATTKFRSARRAKFCRSGMRDFQRGRVAGRQGAAHVWSSRRAFDSKVANLLVATLSGFFTIFVEILDDALEDEQIGTALAGQLDAIAVIPFDRAAKHFAIL